MPVESDDGVGLWENFPTEVKDAIEQTKLAFETVHRDVEKSKTGEAFKVQWRALLNDWFDFVAKNSGNIDSLRDRTYNKCMFFRQEAEKYRNVLAKIGAEVSPIPDPSKSKKQEKSTLLYWLIGIPAGAIAVKWLWNKVGKKSYVVETEDGPLELEA